MTLLQFLAVLAAILILLCLFIWKLGKRIENDWEDSL